MDVRPLGGRDRKRGLLALVPYIIGAYLLLLVVITLLGSWSHRF